ncbi:MAG: TetR/AcrR family transcriptional regulator [Syntrophobacteraceae bacterium]
MIVSPSPIRNSSVNDDIDWSMVEKFCPGGSAGEQRTKFRIFFAAARLFAHKGYNGTAVREIVENAGVTKPTLYYYFANKEDLYVQLIDMAMSTVAQVLDRSLMHSGSPEDRLKNFFSEIFLLFQKNVDLLRLVNLMIYAPRGAVPAYDLLPRHEELIFALKEMLQSPVQSELLIREEILDTALLLLLGLLRSIQIHLVIPEVGPPPSIEQICRAIDVILANMGALRPEVEPL